MSVFLMILLFGMATFLIILVLIQKGKGGGLAGALGGMGGQSAFGTKAGDLFTRITVVVATLWIVLCMVSLKYFGTASQRLSDQPPGSAAPASTEDPLPAEGQDAPASEK